MNKQIRKNKQFKIAKGVMLFTQPKSPYFYGKIRVNKKYLTKSFAPITDFEEAKEALLKWQKSFFTDNRISATEVSPTKGV